MIRTKKEKKPDLILCGDFHLRESIPVCRTDDFWTAQWNKVQEIKQLQFQFGCPVWHSGDLFDHWKPSPLLLSGAMQNLPSQFYTIYGNHDLPQHSLDLVDKCGIRTLEIAGVLKTFAGVHWGASPDIPPSDIRGIPLLLWHVMTYMGKPPWPGCTDLTAQQILDKYPQYALICTGHNHKSFVAEKDGRLLVNPGSLTRQTADQEDHEPKVYLWYSDTNTIVPHILKHKKNVISREHIASKEERDTRIDAFVEMLSEEWEHGVSFEENLRRFEQANNIRQSVMDIVWRAME
jgi:DNA repair exonuclease SbcCD nuclease subunit